MIATPGTRCNASLIERSGSAPMSSAVIASTTVSALRFSACALARDWRIPVTTMSPPASAAGVAMSSAVTGDWSVCACASMLVDPDSGFFSPLPAADWSPPC